MPPLQHRHPSRGSLARRPASARQAQAMLPPPPPGPNLGAFAQLGELPQDVVGAVVGQLRTSLLDGATALRLAGRGRQRYFGTEMPSPQRFTAPANANDEDSIRAGVRFAGNARRTEGKNASRGLRRVSPGVMI
ncbi:MAG TPA: hypothetical protein VFI17_03510 [Solirubrobacterales bacterium]|nr:hypothetical protein [Solirubrobacterales bacterium]